MRAGKLDWAMSLPHDTGMASVNRNLLHIYLVHPNVGIYMDSGTDFSRSYGIRVTKMCVKNMCLESYLIYIYMYIYT